MSVIFVEKILDVLNSASLTACFCVWDPDPKLVARLTVFACFWVFRALAVASSLNAAQEIPSGLR